MTHAAQVFQDTLLTRPTPADTKTAHDAFIAAARGKFESHEDSAEAVLEDMNTDIDPLYYDCPVNGTIPEMKTWVSDEADPTDWYAALGTTPPTADQLLKAQFAYDQEVAKTSPRSTLVTWLEGIPGVVTE